MREQSPVVKARFSRFRTAYLITRYEDIHQFLRDERVVKNMNNVSGSAGFWVPKAFRPLMKNMLNLDEPDHRRLRNLVHKAFTPRIIEQMKERIEAITDQLLDHLDAQLRQSGRTDLMQELALPLPVTVIAEMVGIPKQDTGFIHRMTERLISSISPIGMLLSVPTILSFTKYIRKLAEQRSADPQEDLMTALVQAEEEGDRLSEDELVGTVFLLTIAGHETTLGLIANAFLSPT